MNSYALHFLAQTVAFQSIATATVLSGVIPPERPSAGHVLRDLMLKTLFLFL